jgi:hypothetical protein
MCKHEYDVSIQCRNNNNLRYQSPEYKLYHQQYRQSLNGKETKQRSRLKRYNSTITEYNQIISNQNNQCAICNRVFDPISRQTTAHIDHNHKTGKIRGLLCGSCNRAIDLLQDDPEVCKNAAAYLTETTYACG